MSVFRTIVNKAFGGKMNIAANCTRGNGVPSHASNVGTLYWDYTNLNAYICTVASGTWVKINA